MGKPIFNFRRQKRHWEGLLLLITLTTAMGVLSSCGSSASTTGTTPAISITCLPSQLTVNGQSQCTANVSNVSSTLVNWSVSGTGTGSITTGGLYTAPSTQPTSNVVTITATSQAQSSLTATTTVTIVAATAINAVTCTDPVTSLAATTVASGNQLACIATTSGGATVPVNWTVHSPLGGSIGGISAQGSYTAPLVPPPGQMVTITATSQAVSTESMSVTVSVVFGTSVIQGPYVFSTRGRLTNLGNAFFSRVGSFTAGGGAISGIEDTNQAGTSGSVRQQRTFTGTYSVGGDGIGALQLCEDTTVACPAGSTAATAFFRIVVDSQKHARIMEFSSPATTSASTTAGGEMISQDASVFGARDASLSGTYSFNFFGDSSTSTFESIVGEFNADGFGNISAGGPAAPGEIDDNGLGQQFLVASTYAISSNGRGTIMLDGKMFSFYMVSSSQAKFLEVDPSSVSILAGDAYEQQASATCGWSANALSGSTVLETAGAASGVEISDLGSFTATHVVPATGTVSAGSLDENNGGAVSSQIGTLSGSYTVDPCGRGTLSVGNHTYVFYPISTARAVLQETTAGIVARGFLNQSQGGPFVDGSLTGSYALNLSGTNAAGAAGRREDILAQLSTDGAGKVKSGSLDINSFGTTQTGVATIGTYLPTPAGSLRGTLSLTPTRSLVLYMVSPTQFYILDTDTTGTAIGSLINQF